MLSSDSDSSLHSVGNPPLNTPAPARFVSPSYAKPPHSRTSPTTAAPRRE